MLLGIDVGGTFTDAVAVDGSQVVAQAKKPTTHGNLLPGILAALDEVLAMVPGGSISRIALSTTMVTNALIEGRTDEVGFIIMPGPGLNLTGRLPAEPYVLKGYVDHRGREVAAAGEADLAAAGRHFSGQQIFAVSGKFSVRNPQPEKMVAAALARQLKPVHMTLGSEMAGTLNFLRRTNSAYYNAAVWRRFGDFAVAVRAAADQRGLTAPLYVLKADGGTLPLAVAGKYPVEAVFTGPAASVLGIMATAGGDRRPAVSLDIGGTTTDIALWEKGAPLFAERGAKIAGFPTAVRAFRLNSVGIGGDSYVRREGRDLKVGPRRRGPCMALGGKEPALSDAMIVAELAAFGDPARAVEAMNMVAGPGQDPAAAAREVLAVAVDTIVGAVRDMIDDRAAEPVYRVADIIQGSRLKPELIIGVGGAAGGLTPLVARKFAAACLVPPGAMVANAIGAAVARPTMAVTLRADTEQGYYTVAELGLKQPLATRRFGLADAQAAAARQLADRAARAAITADDIEPVQAEEFNLVRGFSTVGKIITCRMQIKPGVLTGVDGRGGKGAVL